MTAAWFSRVWASDPTPIWLRPTVRASWTSSMASPSWKGVAEGLIDVGEDGVSVGEISQSLVAALQHVIEHVDRPAADHVVGRPIDPLPGGELDLRLEKLVVRARDAAEQKLTAQHVRHACEIGGDGGHELASLGLRNVVFAAFS